ncbi:SDR family NAD(P)-dependent oxidoreductase, partial [Teichococcus aestuarii]|uniref:SDR family NAD(P)-dependent oxidoreductase n=1 Tax=Teichococcus aestuarii TaxID=568898 RepID=UPI003606293E
MTVERRILVTGASSGIGAATARALAGPGVALAVHARNNRAGAERVAAEARARLLRACTASATPGPASARAVAAPMPL